MCGRFNIIDSPGLQQLLQGLGIDLKLPPGINLAPTENIPLIRQLDIGSELAAARWWLTPSWARQIDQKYAMFNARSESLFSSKAYRKPFIRQRGIVPMSSFIEWRIEAGVKQPWLISNAEQAMAVAALWDVWHPEEQALLSCTLVTTAAAPEFETWHKRMPVILTDDEVNRWLDNDSPVAADDPIFRPELKTSLQLTPISKVVGNSRVKERSALEPLAAATVLAAD